MVIETYLNIRATRFPGATRRDAEVADSAYRGWPPQGLRYSSGVTASASPRHAPISNQNVPSNAQAPTHSRARCARARPATYLRNGAGWFRCERLHAHEAARP